MAAYNSGHSVPLHLEVCSRRCHLLRENEIITINQEMFALVLLLAPFVVLAKVQQNELVLLGDEKIGEVVKTKIQYKKASELPASFDYRPLGLLTEDLNQHIPVYWLVPSFNLFCAI